MNYAYVAQKKIMNEKSVGFRSLFNLLNYRRYTIFFWT